MHILKCIYIYVYILYYTRSYTYYTYLVAFGERPQHMLILHACLLDLATSKWGTGLYWAYM